MPETMATQQSTILPTFYTPTPPSPSSVRLYSAFVNHQVVAVLVIAFVALSLVCCLLLVVKMSTRDLNDVSESTEGICVIPGHF